MPADADAAMEDAEEGTTAAQDWLRGQSRALSTGQLSKAFYNDRMFIHVRTALGEEYSSAYIAELSKAHKIDSTFCKVAVLQCIGELVERANQVDGEGPALAAAEAVVAEAQVWRDVLALHAVRAHSLMLQSS